MTEAVTRSEFDRRYGRVLCINTTLLVILLIATAWQGYDSGVFHTIVVRGWMSEMGVRRHYMNTYEDSCIVM